MARPVIGLRRVEAWAAEFTLRIDTGVISAEMVHQLLVEGGQRIGLGEFRPERGGPFGRFKVTSWEKLPQ